MKTPLLLFMLLINGITNAQVTAGLLQEFRFNGTYISESGGSTFSNNTNTSFVLDRFGNTGKALTIQNEGIQATIPSLPGSVGPRSISVWVVSQSTVDNQVFNYGNASVNNAYGFSVQNSSVTNYGFGNDLVLNGYSIGSTSWTHIVTTFDGTIARIYYNGVERASGNKGMWNTVQTAFRLGRGISGSNGFYGHVDDLKIYDRALSAAEVTQLYNQPNSGTAANSVVEYTFDNTYNNINGNTPFSTVAGVTSFVADRNGIANNALSVSVSTNKTSASLIAPTGLNPRSISIWYKASQNTGSPGIFSYGAPITAQTFGMYLGSDGSPIFQGFAYDVGFTAPSAAGIWHHAVVVFDGTVMGIYVDGILRGSAPRTSLNTSSGTAFFLGNSVSMSYDDLKIFTRALTATEVSSLFNNNTLSSPDFSQNNLKVSLYPNPVKDILNIETETEIKSVEIYNLQGQKIKTAVSKQVNVSELSAGIYMVRMEDTNNAVETKRIVKE
jgi:hypothetical protein